MLADFPVLIPQRRFRTASGTIHHSRLHAHVDYFGITDHVSAKLLQLRDCARGPRTRFHAAALNEGHPATVNP